MGNNNSAGSQTATTSHTTSITSNKQFVLNAIPTLSAFQFNLLLLGTGDAGKSTITKTLRYYQKNDKKMPDEEKNALANTAMANIILTLATLIKGSDFRKLKHPKLAAQILEISSQEVSLLLSASNYVDKTLAQNIIKLYSEDEILKQLTTRANVLHVMDTIQYFIDRFPKLLTSQYKYDFEDWLRVRLKTTGLVEFEYKQDIGERDVGSFKIYDTGGQKNERRKWQRVVERHDVDSIVFVVSLSEYDCILYEDDETNRTRDSLAAFEKIVNDKKFAASTIYLVFTKKDVFCQKLRRKDLSCAFPDVPEHLRIRDGVPHPKPIRFPTGYLFKANIYSEESSPTDELQLGDHSFSPDASPLPSPKNHYSPSSSPTPKAQKLQQAGSPREKHKSLKDLEKHQQPFQLPQQQKESTSEKKKISLAPLIPSSLSPCYNKHRTLSSAGLAENDKAACLADGQATFLSTLPEELLRHICKYLSPKDLCKLGTTSKSFSRISLGEECWETLCRNLEPSYASEDVHSVYEYHKEQAELDGIPWYEPNRYMFYYRKQSEFYRQSLEYFVNQYLAKVPQHLLNPVANRTFVCSAIDYMEVQNVMDVILNDTVNLNLTKKRKNHQQGEQLLRERCHEELLKFQTKTGKKVP